MSMRYKRGLKSTLPVKGSQETIYFTEDTKEIFSTNEDGTISQYGGGVQAEVNTTTKCYYDTNGNLIKHEEIVKNVVIKTTNFTYVGDNMTSLEEIMGSQTITTTLTYIDGILDTTTKVVS